MNIEQFYGPEERGTGERLQVSVALHRGAVPELDVPHLQQQQRHVLHPAGQTRHGIRFCRDKITISIQ